MSWAYCLIAWLDSHQGSASALLTAVIAGATIVYVIYTRRLWQQTAVQAEALKQQLVLAYEQSVANREQLGLFARQVEAGIRDVQLRIRPYLACRIRLEFVGSEKQYALRVQLVFRNVGTVPANLKSFQLTVWSGEPLLFDSGTQGGEQALPVVFPRQEVPSDYFDVPFAGDREGRPFRVAATVEYAAPWNEVYLTEAEVQRQSASSRFVDSGGRAT